MNFIIDTLKAADILNADSVYKNDGKLYKKINGKWIGGKSVQCVNIDKTTYIDWFETCDKSKIDTRYYNLDGTKK